MSNGGLNLGGVKLGLHHVKLIVINLYQIETNQI